MKFLDEVKIFVKSGDGGSGCASFRREKFIEFGGPILLLITNINNIILRKMAVLDQKTIKQEKMVIILCF